ncbi:hypothetical protein BOO71_0005176 [Deinococcus marmoris]|uniref:Uncharacterized protein n=2 Tax=Deinococcus marmoris TaxID=249408 RepID=A0A1U7NWE9_9DEIO|nr:hypothetical protein BOO71_0009295 [Deinococcus marmoris]OLV18712.1 hypothetical protein BOO71_0005176 [Deinococcus marmoris]
MYFDFHFTNALMSARTMTLGTQHIKAATVERASTRARPVRGHLKIRAPYYAKEKSEVPA